MQDLSEVDVFLVVGFPVVYVAEFPCSDPQVGPDLPLQLRPGPPPGRSGSRSRRRGRRGGRRRRTDEVLHILHDFGVDAGQGLNQFHQPFPAQVGKELGQRRALFYLLGTVDQVEEGGDDVLAVAAPVVGTGAGRVRNLAVRGELHSDLVRLVLASLDLGGEDAVPPDDAVHGAAVEVIQPPLPGLGGGSFPDLVFGQSGQSSHFT